MSEVLLKPLFTEEQEKKLSKEEKKRLAKYDKSKKLPLNEVKDKRLKTRLKRDFQHAKESAAEAAKFELLLTDEPGFVETSGMERSYRIPQSVFAEELPQQAANKIFTLDLEEFGPYVLDHTRDGRYMAFAGERGHIAMMDRYALKLKCEFNVNETVRAVQFLHNYTMFAVAQKKYCYIYDSTGMELHCMKNHIDVNVLDFLPFHFLLVSCGGAGYLKYTDVSTGQLVQQ